MDRLPTTPNRSEESIAAAISPLLPWIKQRMRCVLPSLFRFLSLLFSSSFVCRVFSGIWVGDLGPSFEGVEGASFLCSFQSSSRCSTSICEEGTGGRRATGGQGRRVGVDAARQEGAGSSVTVTDRCVSDPYRVLNRSQLYFTQHSRCLRFSFSKSQCFSSSFSGSI